MRYLALGDSISIDDYTGVAGGGAVSQFAHLIGATEVQDLTCDGCTTAGVLARLPEIARMPDIVTLTAGGNDFLQGAFLLTGQQREVLESRWIEVTQTPLDNLTLIAERLAAFRCPAILNTVYDPTDGADSFAALLGLPPEARRAFRALNVGIRALARQHGFLLSDLELLFSGHGIASEQTWVVHEIEPNLAGATAIARHWYDLSRDVIA
jgi:lysophospholipase L1-like esterase